MLFVRVAEAPTDEADVHVESAGSVDGDGRGCREVAVRDVDVCTSKLEGEHSCQTGDVVGGSVPIGAIDGDCVVGAGSLCRGQLVALV